MVVKEEGSIPAACRLARVCSLWREVSLDTQLWRTIDLSTYFKEKNRTELRLKWFIENRTLDSEEINISFWKITNSLCVLIMLVENCPNLLSLSLAGWRALSADDLNYIADNFPRIARIDLSSINTEMNTSKTAVGLQSLVNMCTKISDRLTHLNLAHNRLSGIPQITAALTTYCPNLTMLDLSNVKTIAVSHGMLHVEKLQEGCQKLKILRIANSHVQLSQASLQEQMQSPGFPELEELSVASLADESRLMSDEALQRILKSSTKLKLLDVRGCARLTHDSLIRIPAWDLKHLFLSGCSVTRDVGWVFKLRKNSMWKDFKKTWRVSQKKLRTSWKKLSVWNKQKVRKSFYNVSFNFFHSSGLELIASKWAHSLIEFDLAWASVQKPLDNALRALADKRDESPLKWVEISRRDFVINIKFSSFFNSHLNLCGSAVSVEAVKEVLDCCQALNSINLSSCRGLPRGIKRLLQGKTALNELRENLKNGD